MESRATSLAFTASSRLQVSGGGRLEPVLTRARHWVVKLQVEPDSAVHATSVLGVHAWLKLDTSEGWHGGRVSQKSWREFTTSCRELTATAAKVDSALFAKIACTDTPTATKVPRAPSPKIACPEVADLGYAITSLRDATSSALLVEPHDSRTEN